MSTKGDMLSQMIEKCLEEAGAFDNPIPVSPEMRAEMVKMVVEHLFLHGPRCDGSTCDFINEYQEG